MRKKLAAMLMTVILVFGNLGVYALEETTHRANLAELERLFALCDAREIPYQYEQISYNVIKNYIDYTLADEAAGFTAFSSRNDTVLSELYATAAANLNAYLSGTKAPLESPRYVTGDMRVAGRSILAQTTAGERPVYFAGFGHNTSIADSLGELAGYGTNITQVEIGMNEVLAPPTDINYWFSWVSGGASVVTTIDTTVKRSGSGALKIVNSSPYASNVYGSMRQAVSVRPNTTYRFGMHTYGTGIANFKFSPEWFGSAPWRSVPASSEWRGNHYTFTTGPEQTVAVFSIITEGAATIYVDDVYFMEDGTEENLLKNGDFEIPSEGDWTVNEYVLIARLEKLLYKGAQSNIACDILLAQHYFPSFLKTKYPEIGITLANSFLQHDILHPVAREASIVFSKLVAQRLADFPALNSICVANEPRYQAALSSYGGALWADWLEHRYQSVSAMNAAYGTTYKGYSSVPMQTSVASTPVFRDWYDFNTDMLTDWLAVIVDEVKAVAPDVPVHIKLMEHLKRTDASSDRTATLLYGENGEKVSALGDITGNDSYNFYNASTPQTMGKLQWYDYLSSVREAPMLNSEDHIVYDDSTTIVPTAHTAADMWMGAIHGRTQTVVWEWKKSTQAGGSGYASVMQRPDIVAAVGKAVLDLNRLAHQVKAFNDKKPDVAILYSDTSHVYSNLYIPTSYKAYQAASFAGQKVGFVTEGQIAKLTPANYKLLIVPYATNVSLATLNAVNSYAQGGGKVLLLTNSSNIALSKDENNKTHTTAVTATNVTKQTVNSSTAVSAIYNNVYSLCNSLGYEVMLYDASTNQPVNNVQWQYTKDASGNVLLNLCYMSWSGSKTMYVKYNGQRVDRMQSLIPGTAITNGSVPGSPYVPALLYFNDGTVAEPEGVSSELTDEGVRIRWDVPDDPAFAGVELSRNGTAEPLAQISGENSFLAPYLSLGSNQFIVKAIGIGGARSAGVQTQPDMTLFTVTATPVFGSQTLAADAAVTNLAAYEKTAVVRLWAVNDTTGAVEKAAFVRKKLPAGATEVTRVTLNILTPGAYTLHTQVFHDTDALVPLAVKKTDSGIIAE